MAAESKRYIMELLVTMTGDKIAVKRLSQVEQAQKNVGKSGKEAAGYGGQLIKALKRVAIVVPVWMAARAVIQSFSKALSSSIKFMIEWEKQMAQVKMVGGATEAQFEALSQELLTLASAYGASISQIGDAAKLWRQQGRAIADIPDLMEATLKMSILTGRTMGQVVEDLTAIMMNFRVEAENVGDAVDSVTNVMLNHAVTADTLVAAMRDVAAVGAQVGIEFDKLLGMITAMHVSTRAKGSRIGMTWRTVLSRIGTVASTAIQNIAQVPIYMDEMGNASFENTGILRNMGDVLDELAARWDTLGNELQVQLGYAVAGRRRLQLFTAAMQQWEEGIQASLHSLDAYNKASGALAPVLDTTSKKAERVRQSWYELTNLVGDTRVWRNSLDWINKVLQGFVSLRKEAKTLSLALLDMQIKTTERDLSGLDREVNMLKNMDKLYEQITSGLDMRNRIQEQGDERGQKAIEVINKRLQDTVKVLSKMEGMEPLKNMIDKPEEIRAFLDAEYPDIREGLFSAEGEQKFKTDKKRLLDEIRVMGSNIENIIHDKYNIRIPEDAFTNKEAFESFKGFIDNIKKTIIDESAGMSKLWFGFPTQQELEKRVKISGLLKPKGMEDWASWFTTDITSELIKTEEFEKDINELAAYLGQLEEPIQQLDVLRGKGAENYIDMIRQEYEAAEDNLYLKDLQFEFEQKIFELKKQAVETGADELTVLEKELELTEQYAHFLDEAQSNRTKTLQVQILEEKMARRLANAEFARAQVKERLIHIGNSELQTAQMMLGLLRKRGASYDLIVQQQQKVFSLVQKQRMEEERYIASLGHRWKGAAEDERRDIVRLAQLRTESPEGLVNIARVSAADADILQKYFSDLTEAQQKMLGNYWAGLGGFSDIMREFDDEALTMGDATKQALEEAFGVEIPENFWNSWLNNAQLAIAEASGYWKQAFTDFNMDFMIGSDMAEIMQKRAEVQNERIDAIVAPIDMNFNITATLDDAWKDNVELEVLEKALETTKEYVLSPEYRERFLRAANIK